METVNDQGIIAMGDSIVVLRPKTRMTKAEALRHAAWLVALADDGEESGQFEQVLDAVMSA